MDVPPRTCASLPDLFAAELSRLARLERDLACLLGEARLESFSLRLREALLSQETQQQARWRRLTGLATTLALPLETTPEMPVLPAVCAGDPVLTDAALIAQLQRLGHLLLAAYGTARTWALHLEQPTVAEMLHLSLEDVRALDRRLTDLAESGINALAAAGSRTGVGLGSDGDASLM